MKSMRPSMVLLSLVFGAVVAAADAPDTSNWECEYCPVDEGMTATITGGPLYIDTDGDAFHDFRGTRDGFRGRIGGTLRMRDGQGGYTDVIFEDFGLSVGRLRADAGQQKP